MAITWFTFFTVWASSTVLWFVGILNNWSLGATIPLFFSGLVFGIFLAVLTMGILMETSDRAEDARLM